MDFFLWPKDSQAGEAVHMKTRLHSGSKLA
jgi:hypothetical protein